MSAHVECLRSLDACNDAITWAKGFSSLEAAWQACDRSDWMVWLLNKTDAWGDATARRFACRCVRETPLGDGRTVWDLFTDERSRHAVVTAERYIDGGATEANLLAAWEAAWAAAWAAAGVAAWAAAREAAWEAAWAAAGAAARAAAGEAAREAARAHQAEILREMIDPAVIAALCRETEGAL